VLLDAQNPAVLESPPSDSRTPAVPVGADSAAARLRPADNPAASSTTRNPAETESPAAQADPGGTESEPVCAPSEDADACDVTDHQRPVATPPDSGPAGEVAAIALSIVTASVDELAGSAGSVEKDATATSPGKLLQILADVIGTECNADPPPPDLMSDASNAMPESMADSASDSSPDSAFDQIDVAAQLAGSTALPKVKMSAEVSTGSASEPTGSNSLSPLAPKRADVAASDVATSDAATSPAARSPAPPASGNGALPGGSASSVLHAAPEATAHPATPSATPEVPPLLAPSPPSLSKPPYAAPAANDATPLNPQALPASANGPAPSLVAAKADAAATPDAKPNSGADSEAGPHPGHSSSRPVLDAGASPAGRLAAAPTILEAPPNVAAAAPAHQPAPGHATPASVPAYIPPSAPIALADLPLAVALQARSGKSRFAIRLDPPELGRIDVRLDIDTRSNVTLRLVAERPETLDLLRRDAAHIERALQDAGLKTGDQALHFSLHNHFDGGNGAPPNSAHHALVQDEAASGVPQIYMRAAGLGAGVDIRV
jgi:flagellar hook-length control protein FliK